MPKERFVKVCPKCKSTEVSFRASRGGLADCCMNCGCVSRFGFPQVTQREAKSFPAGERNFIPSCIPMGSNGKPTLIDKISVALFMAFLIFVILFTLTKFFRVV